MEEALINWSRAQFALTAMYHWIFVPLTLGLGVIMAIMETVYYKTGNEFWKNTAKFWMKLFGINFAMGVATGIILEFQFGTNWSNYSWFVGDIFGAPLAIEGIFAFFMEATFIALMYFGWNKVSKGAHLLSTWMVILGATLSAVWILVANAWMQFPVGMSFNPDTARNEMVDFWAVALSPVAITKFLHTVTSCWIVGSAFVIGISAWYILRRKHVFFALASIRVAAIVGLAGALLTGYTGHKSGEYVAQLQPMKLAAMEAHTHGADHAGLVIAGLLKPGSDWSQALDGAHENFLFRMEIPNMLSILAAKTPEAYVPGINDLLQGGYTLPNGQNALSAQEKMLRGRVAIEALKQYREAKEKKDESAMTAHHATLKENFDCFGYGYLSDESQLIPPVPLLFYSFRIMVALGGFYILLFGFLVFKNPRKLSKMRWLLWLCVLSVPCAYLASQTGWIVAELGRQPWAIQDILPNCAAVSHLSVGQVQTTFFIFLLLFTLLLAAELRIMYKAIAEGPQS